MESKMNDNTNQSAIYAFTGNNEEKFTKTLLDKGMKQEVVEQLLWIIKSHICDVVFK